ncbi:MAG: hypothetical protein J6C62_03955 [Clostridia bacterium]|nr:hypothetical protein [Clostridia bacterium]
MTKEQALLKAEILIKERKIDFIVRDIVFPGFGTMYKKKKLATLIQDVAELKDKFYQSIHEAQVKNETTGDNSPV